MDGRASRGPSAGRNGTTPNGKAGNGAGPVPRRPQADRGRLDSRQPDSRQPDSRQPDADELTLHPLHTQPNDPPPPAREQLPLPRRRQQAHIAPQLRTPNEAETGTPFTAFTANQPGPVPPVDRDLPREFQSGSRQGRRDVRRRRPE
jgi:hypothetical protein